MPQHFKVHQLLDREQLEKLETFARDPGRTVDEVHGFLLADGFMISRSACWTWQKDFLARDRYAQANALAANVVAQAREGGVVSLGEASGLQLQQMIFEHALKMAGDEQAKTGDLLKLARAHKSTIESQRHLEELKAKMKTVLDESQKKIAAGLMDGQAVVSKVREILGIA